MTFHNNCDPNHSNKIIPIFPPSLKVIQDCPTRDVMNPAIAPFLLQKGTQNPRKKTPRGGPLMTLIKVREAWMSPPNLDDKKANPIMINPRTAAASEVQ